MPWLVRDQRARVAVQPWRTRAPRATSVTHRQFAWELASHPSRAISEERIFPGERCHLPASAFETPDRATSTSTGIRRWPYPARSPHSRSSSSPAPQATTSEIDGSDSSTSTVPLRRPASRSRTTNLRYQDSPTKRSRRILVSFAWNPAVGKDTGGNQHAGRGRDLGSRRAPAVRARRYCNKNQLMDTSPAAVQ